MFTKDEMKKEIGHHFDRHQNYQKIISQIEKKNIFVPEIAIVMACAVFLFVSVMPLWNQGKDAQMAFDSSPQEIGPEVVLNIHVVDDLVNLASGPSAGSILKDQDKKVQIDLNKLTFLEQCCPEGFEMTESELICGIGTISSKGNSTCYRICYTMDEKIISVLVSEEYWPYGYSFEKQDDQDSLINGLQMEIYQQVEDEVYLVLFEMNGMYFDVETQGITENELVDFLLNLIEEAGGSK